MMVRRRWLWSLGASFSALSACTSILDLDGYTFDAADAASGGTGTDGSGGAVDPGMGGSEGDNGGAAGMDSGAGGGGGGTRVSGESCDETDRCQDGLVCELGVCCPPSHLADEPGAACLPVLTSLLPIALTPNDASLLAALSPNLSGAQLTYDLGASFWLTEMSFEATGPEGATILIDGTPLTGQSPPLVPLMLGDNTVSITVRNPAGSREYLVRVQRRRPIRIPAPEAVVTGFGYSVAAAGDVLVVGAPFDGTANSAVYTFRRSSPGVWEHVPEALLRAPVPTEAFGEALRFDGTTLAMGASGEVFDTVDRSGAIHFYVQSGGVWQEELGSPRGVASFALELGWRIDLAGTSAAATSNNSNELYTYTRDSTGTWVQDPGNPLAAPDGIAFVEGAVALDGNLMAAGSHNAMGGPRVFLYERTGPGQAWAVPSPGDTVLQAVGLFADDLALKGTTLVVNGEPVSVYERAENGVWARTGLPINSMGPIALSETSLVIGSAQGEFDNVTGSEIQVLRRADPTSPWQLDPSSPLPTEVGASEAFGISVAVSGTTVFAGASAEFPNGAVYVYE